MQKLIIPSTFSFLLFSLEIFCAAEDEQNNVKNRVEKEPSAKQMLQESYTLVRRSAKSHWERVKYLINQLGINFFPPNLDFRSRNDSNSIGADDGHNNAGETITKAVGKSFQTGEVAVDKSAKSAAKAAEKAKAPSRSNADDPHDEL